MAWYSQKNASRNGRVPMNTERRRALILSYLPDWLLTVVLAVIFFSLDIIEGYRRQFSIDDSTLRFPFAEHERVPPLALYLIAILAPFCIQILVNVAVVRSWWDFHNSTLGLILSLAATGVVTQFTKLTVGRPRPDVISRCQPPPGVTDPPYGLVSSAICTNMDKAIMRDGFRSFPSGHSSLSFAGLGFLAFYLAGKTCLYDEKGRAVSAWISLTPLAAASLVAISRTMDYRHHWQDVVAGGLLGLTMAFLSYRLYYPPLTSRNSGKPYSPRIPRMHTGLRDAEEEEEGDAELRNRPILPTTRPPRAHADAAVAAAAGVGIGTGGAGFAGYSVGASSSSKLDRPLSETYEPQQSQPHRPDGSSSSCHPLVEAYRD